MDQLLATDIRFFPALSRNERLRIFDFLASQIKSLCHQSVNECNDLETQSFFLDRTIIIQNHVVKFRPIIDEVDGTAFVLMMFDLSNILRNARILEKRLVAVEPEPKELTKDEKYDIALREWVLSRDREVYGDGESDDEDSDDDEEEYEDEQWSGRNLERRRKDVYDDILIKMLDDELPVTRIAKAFDVHRNTITKIMRELSIPGKKKRNVDDEQLDELIREMKRDLALRDFGARMVKSKW